MSIRPLNYTRVWTNPEDFPTVEPTEIIVRRDMQALFDEIAAAYNETVSTLTSTGGDSGASGIGVNPVPGVSGTNVQTILDSIGATQAQLLTGVSGSISSVTYDDETGILTFTRNDGTAVAIDTDLEKVVVNFVYDAESETLVLTYPDGHTVNVPLSSLVSEYDFTNLGTVEFTVVNHKVTANVKSSYLADIARARDEAVAASESANTFAANASGFATTASGYKDLSQSYAIGTNGTARPGDATDNAKYYSQQAAASKSTAETAAASAASSSRAATQAASDASTSASNASGYANSASAQAGAASNAASSAAGYASNAASSASSADRSAGIAAGYASNASSSSSQASSSAESARQSASAADSHNAEADASAKRAAVSATVAGSCADEAALSAEAAAGSAANASLILNASIRWDVSQTLNAVQKGRAVSNIGLSDVLLYSQQTLSEANKKQARTNIGATGAAVEYATTMLAANWVDGVYTFTNYDDITAYELEMQIHSDATEEMVSAYENAKVTGVFNANRVKALGDVPTVDILVTLIVRKK